MTEPLNVTDDTWQTWEREIAEWSKRDVGEQIGVTKQQIYGLAARLQLKPPTIIRLHQAGETIHAEPYKTWYGQLKFRHPERIADVSAWCFRQDGFEYALLSDGDIAERLLLIPIAHSHETTSYYQTLDLSSGCLSVSDLHVVHAGLRELLARMEHIDRRRPVSTR